jgi:hypothetical protein
MVCFERFLADADERNNAFFLQLLEKHHARLKGSFDRHVVSSNSAVAVLLLTTFFRINKSRWSGKLSSQAKSGKGSRIL